MTMPERDATCAECKLGRSADKVCIMGHGNPKASVMVIGKMPNSQSYQASLELELAEVGVTPSDVYFTQAVKCRNFEVNPGRGDVKTCARLYLDQEIESVNPQHILVLGNEPLQAVTGNSGIMKYRGRIIERDGRTIIPTISPSAVNRNPGQRPGYMADLRLFGNAVNDRQMDAEVIPQFEYIDTKDKLRALGKLLESCDTLVYDVETHSEEWRPNGKVISISGTMLIPDNGSFREVLFGLPLFHRQSPWQKNWKSVLQYICKHASKIKRLVAHNGKYDEKWMRRFGGDFPALTFDTMLAIHLLNENVQKGLKPQAGARLGVAPWGVDTRDLLNMDIMDVITYNVLDTWYTYKIYLQLRDELKAQPRLLRLFMLLMMPANASLVHTEMRGIWIDVQRLKDRTPIARAKLDAIEVELTKYLPDSTDESWPTDAKGKPLTPNYNASNFARWYLFTHLGLPIIERGKPKDDGRPGDPSMAEAVLLELKSKHPAVQLMLDRIEWQKALSSFFNAYQELYDDDHRIHTNFKLAGTVTGRLSSGKTDADKISGTRGKIRGVNLQQVPRDPFIRGLFGAPPGWTFVEADYSQIELRVAALLAREEHMLQLYAQGADIHLTTAARVAGLPTSQITKEVRKKLGKPVNFGFLYGMGWRKFIATAFSNYGSVFSESEARAARDTYFQLYPGLLPWHAKQRRLVAKYGRVQSPIGRVRHLPDIYSPDPGVRAEAERQAINSPVQGFASDMALLSMTIINQKLRDAGLAAHCLGLVHDAVNFEVRDDHVAEVLPIIKDTMEDMSNVRRKFGFVVEIPIIADIKAGRYWGDSIELNEDQVYDFKPEFILAAKSG
jgi:uracil-DNA glycosylase family 4